mgnify:FL=1
MIATPATPEQCVVGIMALDPKTILYCIDHLSEDDFADGACKAAFAEIRDLYTSRGYYSDEDVILMRNKDTVMYCAEIMPPISGYRKFVKAVKDNATRRKAALLGLSLAEDGKSIDQLRETFTELASVLTEDSVDNRCMSISEAAGRWLMEQNDKTDRSFKTMLGPLDRKCSILPGQMVVVGGRPSAGKTALGLQMALQFAKAGKNVCFFSYETDQVGLFDKLMACWALIPMDEIVFKRRPAQDAQYAKACAAVSQLPLWLINAGGQSVAWISATAASKHADVVIVDYLQLIPCKGVSRYETVTNISMQLHTMAQTTGRLVVALAQLNRGGDEKPSMRDLKESGQIEQDADAVILLGKKDNCDESGQVIDTKYCFILAKNKRGECAELPITFDGTYQRFKEVADYE